MLSKRKFELFLITLFLLFSIWLMNKSFGYLGGGNFYIARHQVGDFGLHLSLIRSFSWGENIPIESPFFPGKPLPYHYYFDLVVGMLEKLGLRIDLAFNGLSILSLTVLLFLIYKFPQKIFGKSKILGILSVILFIFHSNLSFIDFFRGKGLSLSLFQELWTLPNYIHIGPFDGSLFLTFFTWNVFLNQRHLITALALSLGILYFLTSKLMDKKESALWQLIVFGALLGLSSRLHILIFFSTAIVIFLLCILFRRYKWLFYLFLSAFAIFAFHAKDILNQDVTHQFLNPGFLAEKPLTVFSFIKFWFLNLGIAFFLIPISLLFAKKFQQKLFLAVFSLFVIGNVFQLSFRIDHNHSLFNFFTIFANFYIAFFLTKLWRDSIIKRIGFIIILFLLIISGIIELMAVKNDFRYPVALGSEDKFLSWIKNNTNKQDIFLAKQEILDPITLSGRKNYFGHTYYLTVMGYDFANRERLVKIFFEARDVSIFDMMRKEGIDYIVIPKKQVSDLQQHLPISYEDEVITVFKL